MYKLEHINPKDLQNVKIQHQQKIIAETNKKLDAIAAYNVLKTATNDFKIYSKEAQEVDELFHQLLKKNGIKTSKTEQPTAEDWSLEEQKTKLKLIKIRLRLKSKKN